MIDLAKIFDLDEIVILAKKVRENMQLNGLMQWVDDYPGYQHFLNDLNRKGLYIFKDDNRIVASMSLLEENDPPYNEVDWESDQAMVIHRIFVDPSYQKKGIAKKLFQFAIDLAKISGFNAIKIDTHPDNVKMQTLLRSMNFIYRGYFSSINRFAYEYLID